MGMDSNLLKAGVQAHHKAIGSASGGVTSQADFEAINAALGRMIASVPESKVMAIDMGAAMDSNLLKAGVQAHHKAIGSASGGVTSQQVLKAIDKALVMGAAMDGAALKEAAQ